MTPLVGQPGGSISNRRCSCTSLPMLGGPAALSYGSYGLLQLYRKPPRRPPPSDGGGIGPLRSRTGVAVSPGGESLQGAEESRPGTRTRDQTGSPLVSGGAAAEDAGDLPHALEESLPKLAGGAGDVGGHVWLLFLCLGVGSGGALGAGVWRPVNRPPVLRGAVGRGARAGRPGGGVSGSAPHTRGAFPGSADRWR